MKENQRICLTVLYGVRASRSDEVVEFLRLAGLKKANEPGMLDFQVY